MKILFINVPWMKYYTGEGDEEKIVPKAGYNFQYVNGFYYGYADGMEHLAIENLEGVKLTDELVNDVTVIFTSKNREGSTKVVGWYKKATIYREVQEALSLDGERPVFKYSMVAPASHATLLPMEFRLLDAKEMPDGPYFETDVKVISDVAMYIHNYSGEQMNYVFAAKDIEGVSILNYPEYEMYFVKADEFLAKNLYGKAVRCFNKAIQEEPDLAVGYECKGSIFLSLKMYDEAIEIYKRVIALEPDNEQAHYCLGLLYGLVEDYKACLNHLEVYIKERPEDLNAQVERGIALYHIGEKELAHKVFKKAYKKEADHPVFKVLADYKY